MKQYIAGLTSQERKELSKLVNKGKAGAHMSPGFCLALYTCSVVRYLRLEWSVLLCSR